MDLRELFQINLRTFLEAEGHRFDRGGMTLCPFHGDTRPSLHIDQKNGEWVWFCHGCNEGGNIVHFFMKKHNVTKREAIKMIKEKFEIAEARPLKVAEYIYRDEAGGELYKVLRFKPKSFRTDRKMDGVRRVLYHLPEIIKASEVWLLEGEKDCDNVRNLGLTATTSPFGMNHWRPEFAESLKGKKVRICLDVGAEREAEKRAQSLLEAGAAEVKIIHLPGLEREGQDISDWIEMNDAKSNEELKTWLEAIVEKTPAYELQTGELQVRNSFLKLYSESVQQVTDAPPVFILFSGIGLLSGILNKFYFYYPRKTPLNLYILLLAPSTFYRKSVSLDIVADYLNAVNQELLLPESFTSEALLEILSKHSRGLLIWRELIQVKEFQFGSDYNRGLPSLLTDLFDFKQRVRRWTKGEGETMVLEPILSILAAGISTWLVENLKKIDFQGGIWTRFIFVPIEEDDKRKFRLPKEFFLNPVIEKRLRELDQLEPQKMDLSKIYPLLQKWGELHQEKTMKLENELLKATFQRLEVALLKIAALLQLAENGATVIEPETFQEGVRIVEWLKRRLPVFFEEEVVFTEAERNRMKIQRFIKKKMEATKNEILRYSHFEAKILNNILTQLLSEEIIGIKPGDKNKPGRQATIYYFKGDKK